MLSGSVFSQIKPLISTLGMRVSLSLFVIYTLQSFAVGSSTKPSYEDLLYPSSNSQSSLHKRQGVSATPSHLFHRQNDFQIRPNLKSSTEAHRKFKPGFRMQRRTVVYFPDDLPLDPCDNDGAPRNNQKHKEDISKEISETEWHLYSTKKLWREWKMKRNTKRMSSRMEDISC